MTALDLAAAVLVLAGGIGAWWAYRRSLSSLESLGEPAVEPPRVRPREAAEVSAEVRPAVDELNALAARLEAGERLSPAEHRHVQELVGDLAIAEQRRSD